MCFVFAADESTLFSFLRTVFNQINFLPFILFSKSNKCSFTFQACVSHNFFHINLRFKGLYEKSYVIEPLELKVEIPPQGHNGSI